MPEWLRERNTDRKVHVENSNSQNVNFTISSCQRGTSQGSYRIYLEDGSSFFLSIDFFLDKKLAKGVTVDANLLIQIKEESLFVEAYTKAISLVSRQLYTRFNLKRKLLSKDFDNYGIERALDYLEDQGYINDKTFAEKWVQSRIRTKLDSYTTLLSGLTKKGINSSISKEVLCEFYTQEVNDLIIEKSVKKFIKLNKKPENIIKTLVRKGFNIRKVQFYLESNN